MARPIENPKSNIYEFKKNPKAGERKKEPADFLNELTVYRMLKNLGIVLAQRPNGDYTVTENINRERYMLAHFVGIHPWIKNDGLAEELRTVINSDNSKAINFAVFMKTIRAEASPYRNVPTEDLVYLLNRGGGLGIEKFFELCIQYEIPVIDSPNNMDSKLVKYDPKDREDRTIIMVGPFRGPFSDELNKLINSSV